MVKNPIIFMVKSHYSKTWGWDDLIVFCSQTLDEPMRSNRMVDFWQDNV